MGVHLTYYTPDHRSDDDETDASPSTSIAHEKKFIASQLPPAGMGLPRADRPKKVHSCFVCMVMMTKFCSTDSLSFSSENVVQPEAGSYQYSGMHDTGPLVPPKEGGPIAQLIAAIQQAKAYNDTFLTELIEEEDASQRKKRAKTDSNNL